MQTILLSDTRRMIFITIVVILLTTLVVRAVDELPTSTWLASLSGLETGCGAGSVEVVIDGGVLCVDAYPASVSASCPHQQPTNATQHTENLQVSGCQAVSRAEVVPVRYVTYSQAEQYCAQAGKRLLTPREWHTIARSLVDQSDCAVERSNRQPVPAGSRACATNDGVYDLVGNVWEWVDAEVVNGIYNGRELPQSGYVSLVDTAGVVVETATSSDSLFDNAYAWVDQNTVGGIVRGGFFASSNDAGRYAQHVGLALDTSTAGIGFRCIQNKFTN